MSEIKHKDGSILLRLPEVETGREVEIEALGDEIRIGDRRNAWATNYYLSMKQLREVLSFAEKHLKS